MALLAKNARQGWDDGAEGVPFRMIFVITQGDCLAYET